MTDQFLTVTQAADTTGIPRRTLLRKVRNGTIESERMGRMWLIDRDSLAAYVEEEVHDDTRPGDLVPA